MKKIKKGTKMRNFVYCGKKNLNAPLKYHRNVKNRVRTLKIKKKKMKMKNQNEKKKNREILLFTMQSHFVFN